MFIERVFASLVEDAQYHVESIVDLPMQTGYLYDDALVSQAVNERVG